MEGYIKTFRSVLENPIVCKDSEHFSVWLYLLLNATYVEYADRMFDGKKITLQPGQLITSRKSISNKFNISESKVQRVLKLFEIEQQIEQQTCTKNRLISIVNWEVYQCSEQHTEQQVNNKRTTTEQQLNTNKNIKNIKNKRKEQTTVEATPSDKVYFEDSDLNKQYILYLRSRRIKLKDVSIESNKKKLMQLAKNDNKAAILILKESIDNGWQGLFELKHAQKKQNGFNNLGEQRTYDFEQLERAIIEK